LEPDELTARLQALDRDITVRRMGADQLFGVGMDTRS
jgi:hypothetical protein